MNELVEIIKAYDAAKQAGKSCVLATVVHLEGSSYRRPGARMLVLENGLMIGAISGGCLEGDALKKALLTFSEKQSRLVTYDTSDEDDASVGIQLGCEGIIQVLFEYINEADLLNPIELLRKANAKRQSVTIVTLFDLTNKKNNQIGTCFLQEQDGQITSTPAATHYDEIIAASVKEAFANAASSFKAYTQQAVTTNIFVEFIVPVISLVVVGAGNDAVPMMQIASIVGWEVKVVDGRNTHAKVDRFINACQVLVSKPENVLAQIAIDNRTCFVLMTHNYKYDLQMLKALLNTSVPYIGVLGPKKKLQKMLEELKESGFIITEAMLSRIYGPTGLDIGAETAEEIASSIIAEIQAAFNGKNGTMLKWKQDLIHS
jgi:xanthine dehydrogenase accessory factor